MCSGLCPLIFVDDEPVWEVDSPRNGVKFWELTHFFKFHTPVHTGSALRPSNETRKLGNKMLFGTTPMDEIKNAIIEQTRKDVEDRTDEPPMYKVVFYNDDFTPKVFVVEILVHLFHKRADEAADLMWRVHKGNRGVAGVYPREIAETKVAAVTAIARENGFPFKMTIDPDL